MGYPIADADLASPPDQPIPYISAISSGVERMLHTHDVAGSNPASRIFPKNPLDLIK